MATEELPSVSIVTPTGSNPYLFKLAVYNFITIDYPTEKLEWIIVDDGDISVRDALSKTPDSRIRYYHFGKGEIAKLHEQFRHNVTESNSKNTHRNRKKKRNKGKRKITLKELDITKIPLGMKRNLCVSYAQHDIILHMDDDSFYPPESVRTRVSVLLEGYPRKLCVGCTVTNCFYASKLISYKSRPKDGKSLETQINISSIGYFKKAFWKRGKFDNQSDLPINKEFFNLRKRSGKFKELDSDQLLVTIYFKQNYTPIPQLEKAEPNGWHYKKIDDNLFLYIVQADERFDAINGNLEKSPLE